jgi:hypothetical protein
VAVILIPGVLCLILLLVLYGKSLLQRRRGDVPPPEPGGPGNPQNLDPSVQAWRRRRAAEGKGDNWLTRPLIKVDATGNKPFIRFFPRDNG